MDVPVHADVCGTDGPVGKSTYVVMDLVSENVTHVVVQMNQHGKVVLVSLDLDGAAVKALPYVFLKKFPWE